jgi:hypothetical protein
MSHAIEIKVEQQAGGWIWAAIAVSLDGVPVVVRQSGEAFPTQETVLHDADQVLQELRAQTGPTGKRRWE